jgi:phosphoribosyl-ATP pyrophosphohydrolase
MPKIKKEKDLETKAKTKGTVSKRKVAHKPGAKRNTPKKIDSQKELLSKLEKQTDEDNQPVAQAITIDVITDDEDVLYQDEASQDLTESGEDDLEYQDNSDFDVQKKFFSDLVSEMKDKKDVNTNIPQSTSAPLQKSPAVSKKANSLNLYKRIVLRSGFLTFLLLLIAAYFLLPSLKISIQPSFEATADTISFSVSSGETKVDSVIASNSRNLSGEVQFITLTAEKVYESSGEELLGQEVVGEVTLHNEYSRAQPLVANTRLLSSDNKLYRLRESVNIPAGETVKVKVYADQVSQEMAIGPSRFSIPGLWLGLQDRIYATSEKPFEYKHQIKAYVKQADIDQAMIDIKNTLAKKAEVTIGALTANDQNIAYLLDDDQLKIDINTKLGEETTEFIVAAENELVLAFFPKKEAENLIKAKLSFLLTDDKRVTGFDPNNIIYRLEGYDREAQSASVNAAFKANMTLRTDAQIIDRRQLVGLNQEQIAEYLKSFPEIDSYRLEFFPAFIKTAPSIPDRIKVNVVD